MQRIAAIALALLASPLQAAPWALTGSTGAHDPTIVKETGGLWWCFTTGRGLPVKYSEDGLQWNEGVRLFDAELPWWRTYAPNMGQLDVWAPDLQKFGDRYWCYYSVSEFGRNNSAIGLKSCTSILAGDWRDDGFVIGSRSGTDTFNAIDPLLTTDAQGNPWLAFGSWFSGIQLVPLDPATMKPAGPVQAIARRPNGIEGPNVVYANGYYYLFISIDTCCQGAASTYKIAYGRARSIAGPYVDKNGVPLLEAGGTLLEVGGDRWRGPGGQDVYQNGNAWVIARHAYDATANGRPTLRIDDLYWDVAGWPSLTSPAASSASSAPVIAGEASTRAVAPGASLALRVETGGATPVAHEWLKDGLAIPGTNNATFSVSSVQPGDAGIYAAVVTTDSARLSTPAIVGLVSAEKTLGAGAEVGTDIRHPGGNTFDQVLLQGAVATLTADPGQVTRVSYLDLSHDIVQVEFSGAGSLTLALDVTSGPAPPVNYEQPGVSYMRGHARIVIAGANETTHVAIFSIGRINAVNQALFKDGVTYDGWADVASLAILSANGRFGSVRAANASFVATHGVAGILAPGVQFSGPVLVGDIAAADAATPTLVLGAADDVRITGGDLAQPNARAVSVTGFTRLQFAAGSSSHGTLVPAQANRGRLQQGDTDVTDQVVGTP